MPWVVDPDLEQWRRETLDLLALARSELSFMESACEDLSNLTSELVSGTSLGDRLATDMRASVSFVGQSKARCDSARVAAQAICIERYVPDDDEDYYYGGS